MKEINPHIKGSFAHEVYELQKHIDIVKNKIIKEFKIIKYICEKLTRGD